MNGQNIGISKLVVEFKLLPKKEQVTLEQYYQSYKNWFGHYMKKCYGQQTYELMDILNTIESPRVLEVGCGCGTESLWMALHGANVTAIDILDDLLSIARERKNIIEAYIHRELKCNFVKQSLLEMDSNYRYDVIWLEQCFHHLEPRKEAL